VESQAISLDKEFPAAISRPADRKFFYDDVMQVLSLAPPFLSSFLFLQPSVW
jgi:hypothetical protein